MANSYVEYTTAGSGTNGLGQTTFTAPSKFLSINDIRAKGYNGSTWTELTVSSRGTTTVTLSATPTAGSYSKVRIYRATTSEQIIDFQAGARLAESDLDTAYNQGLYVAQEVSEDAGAIGTLTTGLSGITLGGTTSVDNLTATGTVTIPSSTNLSVTNLTTTGIVQIPSGTDTNHFYREGTWTVTSNANLNFVANSNTGTYTRIGNICHAQFHIQVASVSGSNHLFFSLPFTSAAHTPSTSKNGEAIGSVGQWQCGFGTDHVFASVGQSSSNCYLYSTGNNTNWTTLTNGGVSSSSQISVTLTYRIA